MATRPERGHESCEEAFTITDGNPDVHGYPGRAAKISLSRSDNISTCQSIKRSCLVMSRKFSKSRAALESTVVSLALSSKSGSSANLTAVLFFCQSLELYFLVSLSQSWFPTKMFPSLLYSRGTPCQNDH